MRNRRLPSARTAVAAIVILLVGGCVSTDVLTGKKVAEPIIAPTGQTFSDTVDVSIDCSTSGATIRYTVDGTTPSATEGTVYDGPITLSETTTVKAIAYMTGKNPSDVATASFTKAQAANDPPSLSDLAASGDLVAGTAGTITVSCSAADTDGTVESVVADLSSVGGSASQALSSSGGVWQWSGTVTPVQAGDMTVTLTATDNDQNTASDSVDITVSAANQAPSVSNAAVTGSLTEDESGTVTLSCTASDSDGSVVSVTADLTDLGGAATETLSASGDQWTWSGNVTPTSQGTKTVKFAATDDDGATAETTATVVVKPPPGAPTIADGTITGSLVAGVTASVTVQCTTSIDTGTVSSVTVDLSAIGGSNAQALAGSNDQLDLDRRRDSGQRGNRNGHLHCDQRGSRFVLCDRDDRRDQSGAAGQQRDGHRHTDGRLRVFCNGSLHSHGSRRHDPVGQSQSRRHQWQQVSGTDC